MVLEAECEITELVYVSARSLVLLTVSCDRLELVFAGVTPWGVACSLRYNRCYKVQSRSCNDESQMTTSIWFKADDSAANNQMFVYTRQM